MGKKWRKTDRNGNLWLALALVCVLRMNKLVQKNRYTRAVGHEVQN